MSVDRSDQSLSYSPTQTPQGSMCLPLALSINGSNTAKVPQTLMLVPGKSEEVVCKLHFLNITSLMTLYHDRSICKQEHLSPHVVAEQRPDPAWLSTPQREEGRSPYGHTEPCRELKQTVSALRETHRETRRHRATLLSCST